MNKLILLLLLLIVSKQTFARICTATTGNWSNPMTWSCGQVPLTTDTIVIPSNATVTVDCQANGGSKIIYVYGSIVFQNGQGVVMASTGTIVIGPNASFSGGTNGSGMYIGTSPTCVIYEGPNGNNGTAIRKKGPCTCTLNACCTTGLLPTELDYFSIEIENESINYEWLVKSEDDYGYYGIQTSEQGITFETIQNIPRNYETSPKTYSYTYQSEQIHAYHRLIYVNQNADTVILQTKVIAQKTSNQCSIFNLRDQIEIKCPEKILSWNCFSLDGKLLKIENCLKESSQHLSLSKKDLKSGFYQLQIQTLFKTYFLKIHIE